MLVFFCLLLSFCFLVCAFIHDGMVGQLFLQHRYHDRHIYGHHCCQISEQRYVADETDQSLNFPMFNFQSSISYWFSQLKPRITSQALHCTSYIYTYIYISYLQALIVKHDFNLPIWMKFIFRQIFKVEITTVSRDWHPLFSSSTPRVCTMVVPSSWQLGQQAVVNHLQTDSQLFTRWKDRMVKDL